MVLIGVDPHKDTHTAVAVDDLGRSLGQLTTSTDEQGMLRLWAWAARFNQDGQDGQDGQDTQDTPPPRWAVEHGRALAGRLVRTLIAAGAVVVWVPPHKMAEVRAPGRRGKSDPIDALAVARAALREPELPTARLDPVAADLRLLTDRRESLVAARTRLVCQLRWQLHQLAPQVVAGMRSLTGKRSLARLGAALAGLPAGVGRDIALEVVADLVRLGGQISELERRIGERVVGVAPALLAIVGVNVLGAAKLLGEVADVTRFRSAAAFARHTGVAPVPVWSSDRPRYRLSRGGNRQLNTCIHRIVLVQLVYHPGARAFRDRWAAQHPHATKKAAIRALKRHVCDVVYRALVADQARINAVIGHNLT